MLPEGTCLVGKCRPSSGHPQGWPKFGQMNRGDRSRGRAAKGKRSQSSPSFLALDTWDLRLWGDDDDDCVPKVWQRETSSRLGSGLAKSGKATAPDRVPTSHPQVAGAPWIPAHWGFRGLGRPPPSPSAPPCKVPPTRRGPPALTALG